MIGKILCSLFITFSCAATAQEVLHPSNVIRYADLLNISIARKAGTDSVFMYWCGGGKKFLYRDSVELRVTGGSGIQPADTPAMLNPYLRKFDTTSMLLPYLRSNVAAALYATIAQNNLKVNYSDTAAMLGVYLRKFDTTAMLLPYMRKANNLGDLTNAATARTNLVLGNVDNTNDLSKPVSTAAQAIINAALSRYVTIHQASASHTAARVAGTYALTDGAAAAITGTGTLYPLKTIYIAAADYPTVDGKAGKLKLRIQLYVNDVAPTGNYTFGLYPITRPGTSGGAGLNIFTLGTVVASSTVLFTTPAADGLLTGASVEFTFPADGHYVIGFVSTAPVAANSHLHMASSLQFRNN